VHQRDVSGKIYINPLTAALASITRSSTEVYSFVAETIASSFSGSSWTQLNVKKFAQSDLMLNAHLRFRLRVRDLKFPRDGQRTPGETSGRHSSSAKWCTSCYTPFLSGQPESIQVALHTVTVTYTALRSLRHGHRHKSLFSIGVASSNF
jgi:hypothetical protein